jgi:CRP-like cAMP-binding protein
MCHLVDRDVVIEPLKTKRGNSHRMVSFSGSWAGLPEKFGSELFGSATLHYLNAGDTLFQVGDEGDGCYRLDKGFLKVTLTSPEGEERIVYSHS